MCPTKCKKTTLKLVCVLYVWLKCLKHNCVHKPLYKQLASVRLYLLQFLTTFEIITCVRFPSVM